MVAEKRRIEKAGGREGRGRKRGWREEERMEGERNDRGRKKG